jgi:CRISPR-associated protein Cas7/Csp1
VKVSFSISKTESNFFDDFFVRFKSNPHSCDEQTKQRSLNKTYSESDIFNINYEFDCYMLSTSEYFRFDKDKNVFIESFCIKHVEEKERKRRAELLVKGTSYLTGLANQSRNAVVNIPEKVFICFDNKATFKKFFDLNDTEQSSLLKNLDSRDIPYFLGGTGYETSVSEAYYKACEKLNTMDLEDITSEVLTQEEVEEKYKDDLSDMTTKAKEKVKTKKTDSDSESEL